MHSCTFGLNGQFLRLPMQVRFSQSCLLVLVKNDEVGRPKRTHSEDLRLATQCITAWLVIGKVMLPFSSKRLWN